MARGTGRFVDARHGHDRNPGTRRAPWKTITHALGCLRAGETLYLRGGVYYENLYIALQGRGDAPVTVRSHPGELAIIDGGFREFAESPRRAWEPVRGGPPDTFRSARTYPNARYVLAWFVDSMVPLITYQHRADIEERERIHFESREGEPFPLPVYFGPGVWYDAATGHIHARLSRTDYGFDHPGTADYRGVTDPREVGLVVAPCRSLPLFLDGAEHVTLQDLVVRGAGEDAVRLHNCQHVTFDNVVIYCGSYGLRSRSSGPVKFLRSALRGAIPPWYVHTAGCLRNSPGTRSRHDPFSGTNGAGRDVARLNTHVMVSLEGRTEDQIDYMFPGNHHWEFADSDFTDGYDGIHLGGECIEFHHNRVDRFFDDAIYLTPLTPHYLDEVHVYQNLFTRCFLPIGFGGVSQPGGPVYVYRNIIDMRAETIGSHGKYLVNHPFVGHFRGLDRFDFGPLFIYHNTIISHMSPRLSRTVTQDVLRPYGMSTLAFTRTDKPRRVFNNLFVHLEGMVPATPETLPRLGEDVQIDGNVHWDPTSLHASARKLAAFRRTAFGKRTRWEAHSRVGNPRFRSFDADPRATNDYRLRTTSAAIRVGIALPKDLDDPLRVEKRSRPDAGALPFGFKPFRVGREKDVFPWLERK